MSLGPGSYVTDRVRLVQKLRGGAMGSVWIADHETLKSQVVVKLVSEALLESRPDARTRFAREASATALIKSPHVIQIHDYGEMADGTPYMVMELLEGESLHDRIEREKSIPPQETAEILRQVGNALDLAHARGIIHRDIKPQNIFLTTVHGEPLVKVLDFGIAKRASEESVAVTTPGMVVGTLYYVCPERLEGEGEADYRTDLWALAVVAYKALTGELPFNGLDMVEICDAIRQSKFRRPTKHRPELPASLDGWFIRAFYPDPEARFTSAAQMARVFKEALDSTDTDATGDGRSSAMPTVMAGARTPEPPPSAVGAISSLLSRLSSPPSSPEDSSGSTTSSVTATQPGNGLARRRSSATGWRLTAAGVAVLLAVVAWLWWGRASQAPAPQAAPATDTASTTDGAVVAPSKPIAATPSIANPAAALDGTSTASAGEPPGAQALPTAAHTKPPSRAGEIEVPAGPFWMGCNEDEPAECAATERPGREVTLKAFFIDRTEVATRAYGQCVEAGACTKDHLEHMQLVPGGKIVASQGCNWGAPDRLDHPINCVDYEQAASYCAHIGKRLPTEAEWEKAARSNDRRVYPWGNDPPSCEVAVMSLGGGGCGRQGTWAVGTLAGDKSAFGVLDLGGNVREWVGDWYADGYYRNAPTSDPPGPEQTPLRVARGGSWTDIAPRLFRCSTRGAHAPTVRSPALGFRCARDAS